MAWKIEFDEAAKKDFSRLGHQTQQKIYDYLLNRIAKCDDPHNYGDPLKKNLFGFWKYRIGDYRVICEIQEEKLTVLVVRIGHRSKVYNRH